MRERIKQWINDRWPLSAMLELGLEEEVVGGATYAYSFGSAVLFVLMLQILTGVWQLFYYVPTTDHAYNSVNYIRTQVPFGWLIHDIHYWGANAMVILVVVHICRVYIWGAYKRPRELTWLLGVFLFFLTMGMSFTGAPLPWDELGYWALEVGTSIAGTVPVVGIWLKELLRGGATMGQMTLSRMFIIHVAILPGILLAVVVAHLVAFRSQGNVGPWKEAKRRRKASFWPDQAYKDVIVAAVVFLVLLGLCAFLAPHFTGPADALDTTYHPKPEWNFLFLYQILKLFPGDIEFVGTVGLPLVGLLAMLALPFIDRRQERNPLRRPVMMGLGVILGAGIITFTFLGYYSHPGQQQSKPTAAAVHLTAGAKVGKQLFQSEGCVGCHKIHGAGGSTGPELSGSTLTKRSDSWIKTQIKDPHAHDPNTVMPAFSSLSDQQIEHLIDYLRAVGSGASGSSAGSSSDPPAKAPEAAPDPPPKTNASANLVQTGQHLFQSAGCTGCHRINGVGGRVGPELSAKTLGQRSSSWIVAQINNPKTHFPNSIMPSFSALGQPKIKALTAYIESVVKKGSKAKPGGGQAAVSKGSGQGRSGQAGGRKVPIPKEKGLPGAAADMIGNPAHGAVIYQQKCESCHGYQGKGGIPNPGSKYGKIPALDPVAKTLFSKDPLVFAKNIDIVIQNGATPEGPHPFKDMPAYGKTNTMSQQEIAEVEAYIMSLNGVNRGQLINPGMSPKKYFVIVLVVFVLVGLLATFLIDFRRKK